MKLYDIAREPCAEQYAALIEFACRHSDAVMIVFSARAGGKMSSGLRGIRKKLAPWRIKTRRDVPTRDKGVSWPVMISYDTRMEFTIDLYRLSGEVQSFLLSVPSLYAWFEKGLPEDLCFFKNHECWLGSCSHERCGWISTQEELPAQLMDCLSEVEDSGEAPFYEAY